VSGLFQRALEIRNHTQPALEGEEFALEEGSGISREDQQEILQEIEKVSEESRISVTPETMAIRAAKKGFLFPLLVNILFVVLLAGGGYALYYLFQRGQTVLMEEGGTITSAEGKLIEELKRESEAALLAKNREINLIQAQLQDIDRQRQELQANMDEKVAAREAELRSTLEAELAAEGQRLRQQGVSESDIDSRLQTLESERTAEYQSELTTFKQQAEEERLRQEENLETLQQEYRQNLSQAEAERQRVQQEAEAREAEMRSQLDAQAAQLEQATQEAREELNKLAAQQEKQNLAASQLTGFYTQVKEDLQEGNYDGALEDLEAIKEYLDDPSVATLPNILQRREIELFVVDSISSLVEGQMHTTQVDTTSLIASADLLNALKDRVIEGDALFRQGDIAGAEARYREALNLVPEISKVHAYFLEKGDESEQVRRQTLRDFLGRAEAAFGRGEYSAALDNYTKALAYLPEDAATVEKLVDQVRRAGYELGTAQLRRRDSSSAAGPLAAAEGLYNQEDYDQAILSYIDLIGRYPNSTQVSLAAEGIRKSVEALEEQARTGGAVSAEGGVAAPGTDSEAVAALQGEIAALEASLEEKNGEIRDLRARLDAQSGDSTALEQSIEAKNQEIAALKQELENARSAVGVSASELEERVQSLSEELESKVALTETLQEEKQAMERQIASLNEQITSLNGQISQMEDEQTAMLGNLEEEMQKKITRLENVERRYDKLVDSYSEYARQEDALVAAQGEKGLVQSKLYLNAFLSASEDSFPGLWERIKRYDEAFEKAGRASAAQDLSDILFELSVRSRPESRELFLESEKTRYRDVPEMVDLIDDLRVLVRE
jgi:predicted  nucleic acid-binding Zn-ribbon protein